MPIEAAARGKGAASPTLAGQRLLLHSRVAALPHCYTMGFTHTRVPAEAFPPAREGGTGNAACADHQLYLSTSGTQDRVWRPM